MAIIRFQHIIILFSITTITYVTVIFKMLPYYLKTKIKQSDASLKSNNISDFPLQWCRLQQWRIDWKGMLGKCFGQMSWDQRSTASLGRTSAEESYITKWELCPAGHFSRFWIQSVNVNGQLKDHGGDSWRVYIHQGPASLAPVVIDHQDGQYEVLVLITEPGMYEAQIYLDFTLCDGFRDPPKNWFTIGTVQGKYQKEGPLGYIGDDYIKRPLGGKNNTTFTVKKTTDIYTQGFFEYCSNYSNGLCTSYTKPIPFCEEKGKSKCSYLWDGHGQWINDQWRTYFPGGYEKRDFPARHLQRSSGTLFMLGDSINSRFYGFVRNRPLCTKIFTGCKESYNWIYKVENNNEAKTKFDNKDFNSSIILDQYREIFNMPEINHRDSAFLFNMGVHFPISLNFTTFKTLIRDVVKLLFHNRSKGISPSYLEKQQDETKHGIVQDENNKQEGKGFEGYFIWKSTTAIQREKTARYPGALNATSLRFYTYQRVQLFQLYANSVMCEAGIPVLDVYPMSAAYPHGTLDAVHYPSGVFLTVAEALEQFFHKRKNVLPPDVEYHIDGIKSDRK